jgi:hypothetical protein
MTAKIVAVTAALVAASAAQPPSEEQAQAIIAPWFGLLKVATRGDVRAIQEQVLTPDYETCSGYLPNECWGRETSVKVVSNFANSIPDLKFDIKGRQDRQDLPHGELAERARTTSGEIGSSFLMGTT